MYRIRRAAFSRKDFPCILLVGPFIKIISTPTLLMTRMELTITPRYICLPPSQMLRTKINVRQDSKAHSRHETSRENFAIQGVCTNNAKNLIPRVKIVQAKAGYLKAVGIFAKATKMSEVNAKNENRLTVSCMKLRSRIRWIAPSVQCCTLNMTGIKPLNIAAKVMNM